ncbi:MAG TPA: LysM peptidoglycan-binding domain-containing protein [Ilumatobacter sp.]|nr:LysM peptidoglycan-binding domain-containing protein [Ilumatobacter sp.]
MSAHRRAVVATLVGAGCVVLAACGDNTTSAANAVSQVRSTSYVRVEPETTTTTIAPVFTTAPPEGAIDPNEQIYIVQPNDGEGRIASLHGITVEQLYTYNQWPESPRHVFYPNEEVKIPPNSKVAGTGTSGATSESGIPLTTEPPTPGCTHTVVAGDNPTRVSEKYGISISVLADANANNSVYQSFRIGGTLNIPAGAEGC